MLKLGERHLDGGGRALFLLDPGAPTGLEALLDVFD